MVVSAKGAPPLWINTTPKTSGQYSHVGGSTQGTPWHAKVTAARSLAPAQTGWNRGSKTLSTWTVSHPRFDKPSRKAKIPKKDPGGTARGVRQVPNKDPQRPPRWTDKDPQVPERWADRRTAVHGLVTHKCDIHAGGSVCPICLGSGATAAAGTASSTGRDILPQPSQTGLQIAEAALQAADELLITRKKSTSKRRQQLVAPAVARKAVHEVAAPICAAPSTPALCPTSPLQPNSPSIPARCSTSPLQANTPTRPSHRGRASCFQRPSYSVARSSLFGGRDAANKLSIAENSNSAGT